MKLTELQAEAVWLTLVICCGANRDDRDIFVQAARNTNLLEYRFQGVLGFGGKVYVEQTPRVSCYKEDETSERLRKMDHANEFLTILARLWQHA